LPRILLPIEGYSRGALISVEEYGRLAQHGREIKQWVRERTCDETFVELKCASAFGNESPKEVNWVMAIWFLGDNAVQQAVMFKLAWGGHVFRRD
jgi:hypothetical protein